MADRYLLESGAPDGYLLEDGTGVLLLDAPGGLPTGQSAGLLDNPIRRRQSGLLEVSGSLLLTTLAVIATTAIPRTPLYTTLAKQTRAQVEQPANLLLTTLAPSGAAAAPFTAKDFPNPTRLRAVPQAESRGRLPSDIPPPAEAPPFAQRDWPTYTARSGLHASQGFDTLSYLPITVTTPFAPVDQTNPVLALRARQADSVGRLPSSIPPATVAQAPFSQADWPTPYRVRFTPQADSQGPLPSAIPPPPVVLPFAQGDWPVPARVLARQADSYGMPLPLVPVVAAPFVQSDWPLPTRIPLRQSECYGIPQGFLPTLPAPFVQADWPLPQPPRARAPQADSIGPLPDSIPPPPVVVLPFVQADWPVPKGPAPRDTLFAFTGAPVPNDIPPYIPPPVTEPQAIGGGMGGGGSIDYQSKKRRKPKLNAQIDKILDDVVAEVVYKSLATTDKKKAAGAVVKPYSETPRKSVPEPATVDWNALTRDAEAVGALLQMWRAIEHERELDDDEESWLLLGD